MNSSVRGEPVCLDFRPFHKTWSGSLETDCGSSPNDSGELDLRCILAVAIASFPLNMRQARNPHSESALAGFQDSRGDKVNRCRERFQNEGNRFAVNVVVVPWTPCPVVKNSGLCCPRISDVRYRFVCPPAGETRDRFQSIVVRLQTDAIRRCQN